MAKKITVEEKPVAALEHDITLVAGDWSHDGHGMTDNIFIKSNLTHKQIEKAYKAGAKKIGIDLVEDVCEEYEDTRLPEDLFMKLEETGFDVQSLHPYLDTKWSEEELEDIRSGQEDVHLYGDKFAEIYLHFCKIGNPDFQYEIVSDSAPRIHIGGYGCFGH